MKRHALLLTCLLSAAFRLSALAAGDYRSDVPSCPAAGRKRLRADRGVTAAEGLSARASGQEGAADRNHRPIPR